MNTWKETNNTLTREFKFNTFMEAIDFINEVASIADRLNHHPHIDNMYDTVTLTLSTHDAGDIVTDKDRELAQAIDDTIVV